MTTFPRPPPAIAVHCIVSSFCVEVLLPVPHPATPHSLSPLSRVLGTPTLTPSPPPSPWWLCQRLRLQAGFSSGRRLPPPAPCGLNTAVAAVPSHWTVWITPPHPPPPAVCGATLGGRFPKLHFRAPATPTPLVCPLPTYPPTPPAFPRLLHSAYADINGGRIPTTISPHRAVRMNGLARGRCAVVHVAWQASHPPPGRFGTRPAPILVFGSCQHGLRGYGFPFVRLALPLGVPGQPCHSVVGQFLDGYAPAVPRTGRALSTSSPAVSHSVPRAAPPPTERPPGPPPPPAHASATARRPPLPQHPGFGSTGLECLPHLVCPSPRWATRWFAVCRPRPTLPPATPPQPVARARVPHSSQLLPPPFSVGCYPLVWFAPTPTALSSALPHPDGHDLQAWLVCGFASFGWRATLPVVGNQFR